MTATTVQRPQAIEWSVAARAIPGQAISGDLHVVVPTADGAMIAVVDGLGHGEDATAASKAAIAVVERFAHEPVDAIVRRCHQALLRTRGVVMTIVGLSLRDDTLTALGVGNVETVVVRANPLPPLRRESILLRCGVIGYQLPTLHPSVLPIERGDMIAFATDGVREDFSGLITTTETPARLSERILAEKFRGHDDGLVLVVKYLGRP